MSDNGDMNEAPPDDVPDLRLYVPESQDWTAVIKNDSAKAYCYQKDPGDTHFHLLQLGEVYLQGPDEKLCLRCAVRRGVATQDRLHWQNRVRKPPKSHP